jgi:hypothetical protein
MKTSDPTFVVRVNELIAINNERFKSYARAMAKTHDSTFRSLCAQNKERAIHFNLQLIRLLVETDHMPELGHEEFHLAAPFPEENGGVNRKVCFWWDSLALKTYQRIIRELTHIPKELKRILLQQQEILENDRRYSAIAL